MPEGSPADIVAELLRKNHLKATQARLAVLRFLELSGSPQSASDIHSAIHDIHPTDRVTVYRILEAFYRAGLVERTRATGSAWLYHLTALPGHNSHPHFHCSGCGSLHCLPPETVKVDLKRLHLIYPAKLDHLRVSLDGICPKCLAKNR